MHSQQYFDFGQDFAKEAANNDSFVVSLCNLDAVNAVDNLSSWPNKRMLILGEKGSGKSLLCSRFLDKTKGEELKLLSGMTLCASEIKLPDNSVGIVIENIHLLQNEEALFHIINHCSNNGIYLLLTAQHYPKIQNQDLRSRIDSTYKTIIKTPDEELCRILLQKAFSQRQLAVQSEIVEYLLARIERSFEAISNISQILDTSSIAQGKGINYNLVKSIL